MRPKSFVPWLLGLVMGAAITLTAPLGADTKPADLTETTEPTNLPLQSEEVRTIEIFEATSPAVVFITNQVIQRDFFSLNVFEVPQGAGSGFIWDDKGHIVTNYHVIHGASRLMIRMADEEKSYEAEVVGAAPSKDLAVLKLKAPRRKLTPISQGSSDNLKVGQTVLAIGNPFGLDHTLTKGIISALGREIQSLNRRTIRGVIQTDAAINPGNSGGPLLDFNGRLIGMNTAIYSPSGSSAGIGFAVPVDTIKAIVPQLIEHGKYIRPSLGVSLVSENVSQRLGVQGLIVQDTMRGGPADKAGLEGIGQDRYGEWMLGDIILEVDGAKVTTTDELLNELEKHQIGNEIEVTLLRRGERKEKLKIKLSSSEDFQAER